MWYRSFLSLVAVCVLLPLQLPPLKAAPVAYFPDDAFSDLTWGRAELVQELSAGLTALREPSLYAKGDPKFAARIFVRSAFTGGVVVRVEQNVNGQLRAVVKKWKPRQNSSAVPDDVTGVPLDVTATVAAQIRDLADKKGFWRAGSLQDYQSVDGSSWLLEVRDGDLYRAVHNFSPFAGTPVFDIGAALLGLAHVGLEYGEPKIE